jgi:hypothetical protein
MGLAGFTEWKAEVRHAFADDAQDVIRFVVAHPVAAMVGEVELLRYRVPVPVQGIAEAACNHFKA